MASESLLLKWGTLKGWNLNEDGPAMTALRSYADAGDVSMSAMQQHNSDAQKDAICDLIDALDGDITNDWTGKKMTKDEAKTYVREYGKKPA